MKKGVILTNFYTTPKYFAHTNLHVCNFLFHKVFSTPLFTRKDNCTLPPCSV